MANAHRRLLLAIVECLIALRRAINETVNNNDIAGPNVLLQRSGRRGGQNVRAADVLQCPDVGPIVDVRRHYRVTASVPRQQHAIDALDATLDQHIGRCTVRRFAVDFPSRFQQLWIVQARTADDANLYK